MGKIGIMTDTDDTDDLLLIPPDFFAIESDSGQSNINPFYNIVDSLIEQVGSLQNRIKSIESSESFLTNSFDSSHSKKYRMQKHIRDFRKCNSSDDLYVPYSTQSTPQKPHSKFKLNSLPGSPYGVKLNVGHNFAEYNSSASPNSRKQSQLSKNDNNTINEVDTFLSKVKTIQRLNAVRNLENDFNNDRFSSTKSKNKESEACVGNSQIVPPKLQNEVFEPLSTKEKTWQPGDYKNSVPDYGVGIREQLYNYQQNVKGGYSENNLKYQSGDQKYSTDELPNVSFPNDSMSSAGRYPDSDSSTFESISQVTTLRNLNKSDLLNDPIHTNALNILSMHRQLTENSAKKISKNHHRGKMKSGKIAEDSVNLGLLNLADIWNTTSSQILQLNSSQLLQKLQEEKLRRQHCENMVQDLQSRNLELQQKLSVAVKVDDSKNKALSQLQDTLQKLIKTMKILQKEKKEWESEKLLLNTRHSNDIKESVEKIQYYEKEVSKALNIAHGNHEKMVHLEKTCTDLRSENESLKKTQKDLEDLLYTERNKNQDLLETVKNKDSELVELKQTLNSAKIEIDKANSTIASYQGEFSKFKDESDRLQEDLRNINAQNQQFQQKQQQLLAQLEESNKREHKLKEDFTAVKKQMDQNKVDLKNYYQGQVEVLVQNKLKEFQSQLDKSENNYREEIKKREMAIAKTAALHIQQLSEKYSIEIKLLEKKHQEEMKLYQVQAMQYKQQIDELHTKLNHFQEKRLSIAKQLQKIMETQWSEALRIIASGRSPTFNNEESFSTIDQLNSLKTKSYNNLEEILTKHVNEHFNTEKDSKGISSNEEEKNQNDDVKHSMETPVSSRTQGNKQYNDHEVQKYINLLLNKPMGDEPPRGPGSSLDYDHILWPHDPNDANRGSRQSQRERKIKPPWK